MLMPSISWVGKGKKFLNKGRYDEAINAFKNSIELEPEYNKYFEIGTNDVKLKIAEAYFLKGSKDGAVQTLASILEDDPNFETARELYKKITSTEFHIKSRSLIIKQENKLETIEYLKKSSSIYEEIPLEKILNSKVINIKESES